jgi:hypothetical protein
MGTLRPIDARLRSESRRRCADMITHNRPFFRAPVLPNDQRASPIRAAAGSAVTSFSPIDSACPCDEKGTNVRAQRTRKLAQMT